MNLARALIGPMDEARAARIVEQGRPLDRALLGLRAGLSLAVDTRDTEQVFLLARALDRDALERTLRTMKRSAEGRALLADRPAIDRAHVDFAYLRSLPADSLGGAYARTLEAAGLDPDIFQPPPGLPAEYVYVAQRARQTHDLWHVLTGLRTDVPGEVALQAFTYGQLRYRFSLLITIFGLLFFGLRYPRTWGMVRRFYRLGRSAPYLLAVRWEALWELPLAEVRARYGLGELASVS
jgi:ubiquinone biosynthesis protein COQ4